MEFAIPGFIQNLCTPNALSTLMEYLIDYASPETRAAGEAAIAREIEKLPDGERKTATAGPLAADRRERRAGFVLLTRLIVALWPAVLRIA